MKTKILTALIPILVLVILSLLISKCSDSKRFEESLRISEQKAELWRDDAGRSHALAERLQLTNKELRNAKPALIDSIKKDFDVKPRTITKVVTITTTVRDSIPFPIHNPLSFSYKDRWKTLSIGADSLLHLEYGDSIAMVDSKKRYGFLNTKSKYTVEAISYNPDVEITGIRSIEIIPDKPRRIGLGIMVGYGATNTGLSPFIGGGVYYRIW